MNMNSHHLHISWTKRGKMYQHFSIPLLDTPVWFTAVAYSLLTTSISHKQAVSTCMLRPLCIHSLKQKSSICNSLVISLDAFHSCSHGSKVLRRTSAHCFTSPGREHEAAWSTWFTPRCRVQPARLRLPPWEDPFTRWICFQTQTALWHTYQTPAWVTSWFQPGNTSKSIFPAIKGEHQTTDKIQ